MASNPHDHSADLKNRTQIAPSTSHIDPTLSHFTDPFFDPVDYLNNTLPPLSISQFQSQSQPQSQLRPDVTPVSLAALSTQTQSLVTQLSAQNARLSNTLTQLTDEILRGGGRLAYEVEVLRGEAMGLTEALGEGLVGDIGKFVPAGEMVVASTASATATGTEEKEAKEDAGEVEDSTHTQQAQRDQAQEKESETQDQANPLDPICLTQLRTLTQVRARLEQVIHTFNEAMEWPLAPSETSLASSFISVSAPEPGTENQHSREEKGKEVAKKLRAEVVELLNGGEGGEGGRSGGGGVEAAARKVEALRELAGVWKGTAEEKARMRFVEGLGKLVEERRKAAVAERERERKAAAAAGVGGMREEGDTRDDSRGSQDSTSTASTTAGGGGGGGGAAGGLFRNLQRLRDEIYLD
ncbi:uncharacterized protein PADG_06847 [Paracoccidioides brasiliensis Pb18]|uniref:Uncharacterized protein n=1 Tax=Paracoccidioides brasiliensis (strain Pb18) TaxID=502780 RepID=C1GHW1_PARBD|nr:uncharacterized protein PADG_06847 [Paracoccidioides brasiliensis Pb18]EEH50768.1 hypothetical protein PADG_06847 [Paracoccidioides brasiliensis Pb18]ODH45946.1 hypothetical protein GX48_07961 [Paracoccidioides brasiliensis]